MSPQFLEEAAAILRRIHLDAQVPPDSRADAIKDLEGLDARYHEEAVAALRVMITAKNPGWQRAAVNLAEFDSQDRKEVASALREVATSRWVSAENRLEAAEKLSEFGPQYHKVAAVGFRKVIASWRSEDREIAAELLNELGPEYRESAERALRKLSTRRRFNGLDRISAIESLIELAPQHIEISAAALLKIIHSRFSGSFERDRAVELLADIAPHRLPEAAEALRKIISRQRPHSYSGIDNRVSALKSLGEIAPQYRQEATHGMLQMLTDGRSKSYDRRVVATAIAEFGPLECEMAAGWLRDEIAGTSNVFNRLSLAEALSALGSRYTEEAAAQFRAIWIAKRNDFFYMSKTAVALADLGPKYRDETVSELRTSIAHEVQPSRKITAILTLARLGEEYYTEASVALQAAIDGSFAYETAVVLKDAKLYASHTPAERLVREGLARLALESGPRFPAK